MTDEIPELEPIETPAGPGSQQVDYQAATFQRMMAGAPAPAFNPTASKEYYRFLFAGLLIVIGCLMPFDADWSHVGYKHASGGCWLVIGLCLIWTMWGAINMGALKMKWVLLCFFPFIWSLMHLIWAPFPSEEADPGAVNSWVEIITIVGKTEDTARFHKIGQALQVVGPGKIFIFVGSLWAVFGFFAGIFGGVQRIKEQKAERSAAAAARRGR